MREFQTCHHISKSLGRDTNLKSLRVACDVDVMLPFIMLSSSLIVEGKAQIIGKVEELKLCNVTQAEWHGLDEYWRPSPLQFFTGLRRIHLRAVSMGTSLYTEDGCGPSSDITQPNFMALTELVLDGTTIPGLRSLAFLSLPRLTMLAIWA